MESIANRLEPCTNQYSLAIRLLIENKSNGVTMKEACKDLFYKFQSRLGEIERSLDSEGHPRSLKLKINRLPMTKKNRFNHTMTYTIYKSLAPTTYLIHLHNYLNKFGIKARDVKPSEK